MTTYSRTPEDADVISIGRFISALARYWWLIALGTVGGVAATWALTAGEPDIYASEAKILVQQSRGDANISSGDIRTSRDLAATYEELINTRPVLEEAATRLNANRPPAAAQGEEAESQLGAVTAGSLAGSITVTTVNNTQILTIRAEHQDPGIAAEIANTVAEVFIEQTRQSRLAEIASFQQAALAQGLTDIGSLTADQLGGLNSLRVIESAQPAGSPVGDNRSTLIVLGGALGLMAAAGLAILLEFLIDVVRNKERFEELFEPPVLAVLPRVEDDLARPLGELRDRGFEEAVRFLRTNLQFVPADRLLKIIAFTAAEVGAGKSTATSYLAKTIVQAGKRVIVVDGDMRRPTQDQLLLGRKQTVGLSSYLADASLGLDDILIETELEGLSVIPSGPTPPNPSELLNSERLSTLLAEASERADYVLLDAPPTLAVSDTPIIAGRVDGVVFVVDTLRTRSRAVSNAFQSLSRVNARILGTVLNKYRPSRLSYYYGYGGYDYAYYDSYGDGELDETAARSTNGAHLSTNGRRPAGVVGRLRRVLPAGRK